MSLVEYCVMRNTLYGHLPLLSSPKRTHYAKGAHKQVSVDMARQHALALARRARHAVARPE